MQKNEQTKETEIGAKIKKDLEEYLKAHPCTGKFTPGGFYNETGDQLEIYWDDEAPYSESVHDGKYNVMAIHKGMDSGKVVGVSLYSIKLILEEAGFKLVPIEKKSP